MHFRHYFSIKSISLKTFPSTSILRNFSSNIQNNINKLQLFQIALLLAARGQDVRTLHQEQQLFNTICRHKAFHKSST